MRRSFIFLLSITFLITISKGQEISADHWESLVQGSDTWRYFVNSSGYPQSDWYLPGFDDSSWPQGSGGFGYADGDDVTSVPNPPYPVSVHVRIVFNVFDTAQITAVVLSMDFDDGFAAWLNGVEIARSNLGSPGENPATAQPQSDHEALLYQGQTPPSFLISKTKLGECLKNGDNVLAVQVNNFGPSSSDLSCIPFLSAGIITDQQVYRPVPWWFVVPYTGFQGSVLPLIMINTNGVSIPSEIKATIDFGVIDHGNGNLNYPDDPWNSYNGKAGIEYRGSSSMGFPKRNYGIETRSSAGLDSVVSLLGLPAEEDWVLHGPYSDKSLVRNRLAYDLAREMGHYASRGRFCEMFIDGQYQGVYVLFEKIKRDSNRVDIADLDSNDLEGHDLTGGYIIKIDRSADGSYRDGWFSNHPGSGTDQSGPFFAWHYPKWEEIQPLQMNYIRNRITRFEDALFGNNYLDPYVGYRSHINVLSFIDYFILVEMSKNVDGYRLSTFLHKDRDDIDPRIHMGPVWDYDLAFGNADYYEASDISGWSYSVTADGWGTPYWWSRFMKDPYFVNNLNCRWNQLRQHVLSNESITALIDDYQDIIGVAEARNFEQWPIHSRYIWPNAFVGNTYLEDVNFMKTWILNRMTWMDDNMPGNCTVDNKDIPENSFYAVAKPNPSKDRINLEIQNPERLKLRIEVVNLSGIAVYSEYLDGEVLINLRIPLKPGIYLVRVSHLSGQQILKVLVE